MSQPSALACLQDQWVAFLLARGHDITIPVGRRGTVLSRNGNHRRYRWLLFVAGGAVKRLGLSERRRIAAAIDIAELERQRPFVVVHFTTDRWRLVIQPAADALRSGQIRSDKGGIDWPQ